MAIRWIINFEHEGQHSTSITIEDSTFSGTAIQLTPADNAFTLSRKMSDIYEPIVNETGMISIIDTGDSSQHIEDIHPLNAMSRPVTVYYDGVLNWRGYVSPEALTIDNGPAPRVISFPVIGALNILNTMTISDETNETYPKSVAYYLYYCLQKTGYSWANIHMSTQMHDIFDPDEQVPYYIPELRLGVSIFNFLSKNNSVNVYDEDYVPVEGATLEEVLSSICRFFGWTLIADGYDIYLSTPLVDLVDISYYYPITLTWSQLNTIATSPTSTSVNPSGGTSPRPSKNFSDLQIAGINHRKTISNGYKKVTITHELKESENGYPEIEFNGKTDVEAENHHDQVPWGYGNTPRKWHGIVDFLDPTKEVGVTLHNYAYNSSSSVMQTLYEIDWAPYNPSGPTCTPRADIVTGSTDMRYDNNDELICKVETNKYLRLCRRYVYGSSPTTDYVDLECDFWKPLASIESFALGIYPKGGFFCFNCFVRNQYVHYQFNQYRDFKGLTQWGPYPYKLRVVIKCGNKYWTGTEWGTWPTVVAIQMEGVSTGTSGDPSSFDEGRVQNTNVDSQFDEAEGYIIPITEDLIGKVTIYFLAWQNDNSDWSSSVHTLFLRDIKFKYYNALTPETKDPNKFSLSTGIKYPNDKQVSLNLTSVRNPICSPSILVWKNEVLGIKALLNYIRLGNPYYHPEQWMIENLKLIYTKPSEWLIFDIKQQGATNALLMWTVIIYNGKHYLITSMEIDYANGIIKLTIATYE